MPQLVRTTNDLINSALYLLGELGVGEVPDAFMLTTGLEIINEILDSLSAAKIYIPYTSSINFTLTPNKSVYTISDMTTADINTNRWVGIDYASINVVTTTPNTLILPLTILTDTQYYDLWRLTTLVQRPAYLLFENKELLSQITFYPTPDLAYPCQIRAAGMLSYMTNEQNLTNLPPYFYGFLKYSLAREFKAYYPSNNWTQQQEDKYQEYYGSILAANKVDMAIRPTQTLNRRLYFGWYGNIIP